MSNPNFIIIGERRSGSTTLYDLLNQHPDIGMLPQSDYDFFIETPLFSKEPISNDEIQDWNLTHNIEDYYLKFENLKGVTGQKDADLLWWYPSHKRLQEYLPDTKFIIVLRNPVTRAESQYFNELSKGRETLSFKEALNREEKNQLTLWQKLHLQYKQRGVYIESLQLFFKYIPQNRVKVVILEELIAEYEKVMEEVCQFLEISVEEGLKIKLKHSNKESLLERKKFAKTSPLKYIFDFWERLVNKLVSLITKDKTKRQYYRKLFTGFYKFSKRENDNPNIEEKISLKSFYEPHNKKLEIFLGKSLRCWE